MPLVGAVFWEAESADGLGGLGSTAPAKAGMGDAEDSLGVEAGSLAAGADVGPAS